MFELETNITDLVNSRAVIQECLGRYVWLLNLGEILCLHA